MGHAVGGPQRFLRRQLKVALDVQSFPCMSISVDGPCRERQQFPLLVLRRHAVGLLEPAGNRRILTVNDLPLSEEIAGKGGPRRPFDHLLETAAWNHFGVNVDAVFDQDAEYAFVVAIARQAPADAVRLDDPHAQRLAIPDRFRSISSPPARWRVRNGPPRSARSTDSTRLRIERLFQRHRPGSWVSPSISCCIRHCLFVRACCS